MRQRRPLAALWVAKEQYGWKEIPRPRMVPEGCCEWCGKPITNKRRKSFCSDECSRLFGRATVWEDPRKGYGKQIVYRDNFTCQKCGQYMAAKNKHGVYLPTDDGLEIHHIKFVADGGTDAPDNLICLCHECHLEIHGKSRR